MRISQQSRRRSKGKGSPRDDHVISHLVKICVVTLLVTWISVGTWAYLTDIGNVLPGHHVAD